MNKQAMFFFGYIFSTFGFMASIVTTPNKPVLTEATIIFVTAILLAGFANNLVSLALLVKRQSIEKVIDTDWKIRNVFITALLFVIASIVGMFQ